MVKKIQTTVKNHSSTQDSPNSELFSILSPPILTLGLQLRQQEDNPLLHVGEIDQRHYYCHQSDNEWQCSICIGVIVIINLMS